MFKNNELLCYLSPHSETESEDFPDHYQNTLEKHSDSIIPTSEAYELQSRKTSSAIPNKSQSHKSKLKAFQSQISQDLQKILSSYKVSLELFTKPKLSHLNSYEYLQRELELRESSRKAQDSKLVKLKKHYEEQKAKIIEEKRDSLQKFWRGKVFSLNGKLQEAEWKRNSKYSDDEERIKHIYEKAYKDALKSDAVKLEEEIEQHFSAQFQDKLAEMTPRSSYRDEEELREAMEDMLQTLKVQEKIKWDSERKKLREICEERVRKENELEIQKAEKELREKWIRIESERMERVKKEIEAQRLELQESQKRRENVTEDEQNWVEETLEELKIKLIDELKQQITPGIEKELKKNLASANEAKAFKIDQEVLFRQVGEELSTTFEYFKKETEIFLKKQLKISEDMIKDSIPEKIKVKTQEKLEATEKEAYIKYLQKLELQKQRVKKQFEENDSTEMKVNNIQKLKEALIKEKQILGQFKAKNNLQIGKIDEDIKRYLKKLQEDSAQLESKFKELNLRRKKESRFNQQNKMISKTPSRPLAGSSALSPDLIKFTPNELIPTCSSAKGIHLNYEFSTKINSPEMEKSPRNLHTQFSSKVLFKDSNTKSLSYDNLKFQSKDILNSAKLKQNVYHELLKEKFGFIQPRLK